MMKKIILSIAIFATAIGATYAQSNNTCPACPSQEQCTADRPQMKRQNAFEGLNLTDVQKAELEKLRKDSFEQHKTDKKESKKEDVKLMRERKAANLAKIKEILTPEQYVQFLENKYLEVRPDLRRADQRMTKDFKKGSKAIGKEGKRLAKSFDKQEKAEK